MRNFVFRSSLVLAALALSVPTAHADQLSLAFNSSTSFSGIATAGSLSAVFVGQSNGTVLLTLTSNLATGENLDPGKAWYFNFNPVKNVADLSFSLVSFTGLAAAAVVNTGENAFKASGDGFLDIQFTYASGTKPFTIGQSQTYLISYSVGPISAADFDFMSSCGNGCGNGSHLAAVHIQNTPAGASGSDWNGPTADSFTPSVPEPSSMLLLGSAFVLLGGAMRQQCKRCINAKKTAMGRQGGPQVDFGDPLPCVAMPRHRT